MRSEGNKKLSLSGLGRTRSLRLEVESKSNRKRRRRSCLVWPGSPVVQFRMNCTEGEGFRRRQFLLRVKLDSKHHVEMGVNLNLGRRENRRRTQEGDTCDHVRIKALSGKMSSDIR